MPALALTRPSARQLMLLLGVLSVLALVFVAAPELAAAAGGNPLEKGANKAKDTAKAVFGAVFVILLGVVSLRLFAQRNFGGLAVTLLVGAVVAWIIFNPDGAGQTLQDLGDSIFG